MTRIHTKQGDQTVWMVECNTCKARLFEDDLEDAKANAGWTAEGDDDGFAVLWRHTCGECNERRNQ